MKAECECGKSLKPLYWSKHFEPDDHSQIIALEDYFYCPWCNLVYQREIKTEVLWHKLQSSDTITNTPKGNEVGRAGEGKPTDEPTTPGSEVRGSAPSARNDQ